MSDAIAATRTRIIVVANQKGGVGKTTTAINLGTAMAAVGERVLVVDMDPQGNASTGFGLAQEDRRVTTYDILIDRRPLGGALAKTMIPNLQVVPSTVDLAGAELELVDVDRRSFRLRDALADYLDTAGAGSGEAKPFDYVLIDCPPSLGLLTVNAMAAGNGVLVPLQCEFFALEGLSQLMRTIELVKGSLNPNLDLMGVVLTMFDRRNNLSEQVAADVRDYLGDKVYRTVIPRNVKVSEAPSFGKPALLYDHRCAGSQAYMKLASEIIQRERSQRAA